jgi:hypothetical protein
MFSSIVKVSVFSISYGQSNTNNDFFYLVQMTLHLVFKRTVQRKYKTKLCKNVRQPTTLKTIILF